MQLSRIELPSDKKQYCKDYCFQVIHCIQYVHNQLGPSMTEYVYQEALAIKLKSEGFEVLKEYQHHPIFDGKPLAAFIKMDLIVKLPGGNIIIECKSISEIGDRERLQTFGYLCGTKFPFALLANFGTYPKAQIERYYYDADKDSISAF